MQIVGGKVTKTSAEKFVDMVEQTSLNLNLSIKEVSLKAKQAVVKYAYTIEYGGKQAKMEMAGELYLVGTDKELKEIDENWKKKKNLEPAIAENILNSVTYTGMAVGTLLAFSISIPAPLTMQKLKVDSKPSAA